jgi:protein-disulfide isomerase
MENGEEEVLTKKQRRELAKEQKAEEREKKEASLRVKKAATWLIVLAAAGWLGFRGYKYFTASSPEAAVSIQVLDSERIKGNKEAKVTLIEYGDFQCPSCAAYYPLVGSLLQDFPDDLRFIYRHFPLTQIHKNAMPAAIAAEAAGKQDKFWEMYDLLFQKQEEWAELSDAKDKFLEYARQLELNEEQFLSDFDSKEIEDKILAEVASGNNLGVNATPTFFLSGVKVAPRSYNEFKSLIEKTLEKENNE